MKREIPGTGPKAAWPLRSLQFTGCAGRGRGRAWDEAGSEAG
jgi:hypothetical protein